MPETFPDYASVLATSFTGTDENPIADGGNWAAFSGWGAQGRRLSNQFALTASDFGSSIWKPTQLVGLNMDIEIIVTIATWDASGNFDCMTRLHGNNNAAPTLSNRNGYAFRTTTANESIVERYDNNVIGPQAVSTNPFATGDKFGLASRGPYHAIWRYPSGGPWAEIVSLTDSKYQYGRFSLGGFGTVFRYDDLYIGVPTTPSKYLQVK